ncbi:MAG: helix-turn-helix domain-containing protein [Solirubrobacteraceae bacterium]
MTANSRSPKTAARIALLHAAAADGILGRLDEVVPKARQRILDEQPAYRRMTPAELDDVTGLLYSNFRMVASAMAGHRVAHEQLDYVGRHVRVRVHSGIPLDAVMRAYRTGFNMFWEECTAEVASHGLGRDAAVDLARKMSEAMDTLTTHAAAAYVREESYLRSVDEKAARDLLDALLRGDVDPERAEPHTAAPGLDPQADLVVVIGRVSPQNGTLTAALETAAAALADALATRRASPLLVIRERAIVAVVPAEDRDHELARLTSACTALKADTGLSLYCGLSPPCAGFSQVASAYEQASLAVARATEERPVVSLAALPALQHLLTGATGTTRTHLLEKAQVIAELSPSTLTTMKETLYGFARADMNVTRAAARLLIHENTLRYRLRRAREHSGHNPQTFEGLVELICLLEMLEHEAQTGATVPW